MEYDSSQKWETKSITVLLRYNPILAPLFVTTKLLWSGLGYWEKGDRAERTVSIAILNSRCRLAVFAEFADIAENMLDDLPIIWASTPAREIGYILG